MADSRADSGGQDSDAGPAHGMVKAAVVLTRHPVLLRPLGGELRGPQRPATGPEAGSRGSQSEVRASAFSRQQGRGGSGQTGPPRACPRENATLQGAGPAPGPLAHLLRFLGEVEPIPPAELDEPLQVALRLGPQRVLLNFFLQEPKGHTDTDQTPRDAGQQEGLTALVEWEGVAAPDAAQFLQAQSDAQHRLDTASQSGALRPRVPTWSCAERMLCSEQPRLKRGQ